MATTNELKHIHNFTSRLPKEDVIDTKLLPVIIRPQTLTVVAAQRKNGKTSLLTQIAVKVAKQNKTVAFFTKQEKGQHFCKRLRRYLSLNHIAKLPIFINDYYALTEQELSKKEELSVIEDYMCGWHQSSSSNNVSDEEYYKTYREEQAECFLNGALTSLSIREQCNKLVKQQGNIGTIVIDGLELFEAQNDINAQKITMELKQIAIDFNCALVVSSNFKRPLRKGTGSKITDITNNNKFIVEIADNLLMLDIYNNTCSSRSALPNKAPAKMSIRVATHLPLLSSFTLEI